MGLLDEIDARTFRSAIFTGTDLKSYNASEEVMKMLGLPNPKEGAHYHRDNSNRIYLPQGLVVTALLRRPLLIHRAAQKIGLIKEAPAPIFNAAFVERDDILQPLLTIPVSDRCIIEINAGVPAVEVDGHKHLRRLSKKFEAQGMRVLDRHPETVGALPDPEEEEPVVLFRNRRALALEDMVKAQGEAVRQGRILGELQEIFADAARSADNASFHKAYKFCERIVALPQGDRNRILDPYWTRTSPDDTERQREIALVAKNYARQLNAA